MWISIDKNGYIFTIAFIKTTHQRLIHNLFLFAFSICGGIIGGKFPEIYSYIGSNIFEDYIIIKGLSYLFYSLATPVDEQKLYDLGKTKNFEKMKEMRNSKGLISNNFLVSFINYSFINNNLYFMHWNYFDMQKK